MPKLSVIVPVYNVEKYIERCARSLFEQTLDDIEYIFVDDCSPDGSISVLKHTLNDYPERVSSVKVLSHSKNEGQAIARRTGLAEARGEYIAFCDSDDWIDTAMYEKLVAKAEEDSADIVFSDYYNVWPSGKEYITTIRSNRPILGEVIAKNIPVSLCPRIFKKKLFENELTYPVCNMGEDFSLFVQLVFYAQTISYVQEGLYYYYQNPQSTTHVRSKEAVIVLFNDAINNTNMIINFLKSNGLESEYRSKIILLKHYSRNEILNTKMDRHVRKLWLGTFREINFLIPFMREIPVKERCKYIYKTLFNGRNQ